MSRTTHSCLSVRGALLNWSDRRFEGLFRRDDGTVMTAREAKMALLDELAQGHEVIPLGAACEGFDYRGRGCPGHENEPAIPRANEALSGTEITETACSPSARLP